MHASLHAHSVSPSDELPVFDSLAAYTATRQILEKLIAFNTVKPNPTRPAMEWVKELLESRGIRVNLVASEADPINHAGLVATLGPWKDGGLAFSGHMDVVPVEGQTWDTDPFLLTEKDGLLYGRGTTDMKGYVAASLATLIGWAGKAHLFETPLQLFLTYDEETGFISVRELMARTGEVFPKPKLAVIGEPTMLDVVTAHKGTVVLTVSVGTTQNGATAADITSALVAFTRNLAGVTMETSRNAAFDPPYTSFNAGVVRSSFEAQRALLQGQIKPLQKISIDIKGDGCHSSTPARGINALAVGEALIAFARGSNGVCVRSFSGGSAPNVVPDKARIDLLVDPARQDAAAFASLLQHEADYIGAAFANDITGKAPVITVSDATPAEAAQPDNAAEMKIQFRPILAMETDGIISKFEAEAERLAARTGASIAISHRRIVPPLEDRRENPARDFALAVVGREATGRYVSYGTEASIFQQAAAIPAVVCGPGHINVAHTPNEAVDPRQLQACLEFQDRAVRRHLAPEGAAP